MHPIICTNQGATFDFTDPAGSLAGRDRHDLVSEIAHALSHICRFGGHTLRHYSVAEHSVLVSHLVEPEHALAALLHDAHEAYIGDVPSPLKAMLPDFQMLEDRVQRAVMDALGIKLPLHPSVKRADLMALATESRLVCGAAESGLFDGVEHLRLEHATFAPVGPSRACAMFLLRYEQLLRVGSAA